MVNNEERRRFLMKTAAKLSEFDKNNHLADLYSKLEYKSKLTNPIKSTKVAQLDEQPSKKISSEFKFKLSLPDSKDSAELCNLMMAHYSRTNRSIYHSAIYAQNSFYTAHNYTYRLNTLTWLLVHSKQYKSFVK